MAAVQRDIIGRYIIDKISNHRSTISRPIQRNGLDIKGRTHLNIKGVIELKNDCWQERTSIIKKNSENVASSKLQTTLTCDTKHKYEVDGYLDGLVRVDHSSGDWFVVVKEVGQQLLLVRSVPK
ncbi:hypothetical protein HELRODRAFT_169311 [Helobdella robusta]|uniref:Uncharacterized protein n=1 Tax=Helobdella robusta TaxID=6412 RepID=T1F1R7_HELRO|nr:hypothetical protein HELRODRAFT_169311 [Helobdella robusta]ESO08462.1 hypothetical protein HELRODRAFT_169311 [Helobdella robusta]